MLKDKGVIMTRNIKKYHITIRIIHWIMALLILGLIAVGWYMVQLERGDPMIGTLYGLHKSFGVMVIMLAILRVFFRLFTKIPEHPKQFTKTVRIFSRIGHFTLYALFISIPISGYAMSSMAGYSVKLFGYTLPSIFEKNKEIGGLMHEYHELLPYILLAVIALHIMAVVKHRFFDVKSNDVLPRML